MYLTNDHHKIKVAFGMRYTVTDEIYSQHKLGDNEIFHIPNTSKEFNMKSLPKLMANCVFNAIFDIKSQL